ncbi:hypothetical protein ACFRCI_34675 [Streptomyces sp. NPDC056638]|uniref:hypothetical protein n=1 Tax=Streptomyces sp. NPDC056638 TaxID=3345887 RepID=UPI00368A0066
MTMLHDAIARDLGPGFMAGLREGIPAARGFDPAFQRPAVARNEVWEGDHKQAETVVMTPDGKPSRVWVTWFEDRGTSHVMGWAVTAGSAHRGWVLAVVRMSVLREAPYGPAGGAWCASTAAPTSCPRPSDGPSACWGCRCTGYAVPATRVASSG